MASDNISRQIKLEGLNNTRDLGGIRTMDGKTVRSGRLIRSGALRRATESDAEMLVNTLKLRAIVDFRIDDEKDDSPDPAWPGVARYEIPILEVAQMGITQETGARMNMMAIFQAYQNGTLDTDKDYLAGVYTPIVSSDNCIQGYREFFNLLMTRDEGATLYHCSAGKDRVGIATALILTALGVDRAAIVADYMATDLFMKDSNDAMIQSITALVKDEKVANLIRTMTGVKETYINSVFEYIEGNFPSMEAFFAERLDIDADGLARFKELYLED